MLNTEFLSSIDEACTSAPLELQQITRSELTRMRSFLAQFAAENRMHFSERRAILSSVLYCIEKIDRAAVREQYLPLCVAAKSAHDELRRHLPGIRPLGAVAA